MEQYPCAAMNYPTGPEVIRPIAKRSAAGDDFSKVWRQAMQDRVMHLIFKKFNTLGGYIAENLTKLEE
jgi:hypothetical protein